MENAPAGRPPLCAPSTAMIVARPGPTFARFHRRAATVTTVKIAAPAAPRTCESPAVRAAVVPWADRMRGFTRRARKNVAAGPSDRTFTRSEAG
jgi:hypothetical protein